MHCDGHVDADDPHAETHNGIGYRALF